MPFALRIRLDPIFASGTDGAPVQVTGVTPSFTTRGDGLTKAPKDTPVPAKLEFVGHLASTVRDHPEPVEVTLGELSGTLTLTTGPTDVRFDCDGDSLEALTAEPDPDDESDENDALLTFAPRALDLVLGTAFRGAEQLDVVPQLLLPSKARDFHYLEVVVKLSLQGAVEADFDDNDVLDVPLSLVPRPLYPFSL